MAPHIALAQRARRYARTRCPLYGKGRTMAYAVQRYAARVALRMPSNTTAQYLALVYQAISPWPR